jgi:hypothetical protein
LEIIYILFELKYNISIKPSSYYYTFEDVNLNKLCIYLSLAFVHIQELIEVENKTIDVYNTMLDVSLQSKYI